MRIDYRLSAFLLYHSFTFVLQSLVAINGAVDVRGFLGGI